MAKTVSDFLVQRLYDWGIRRIYGYPGDGINGIMGALGRAGEEKIRFVQARHEELAAFMACAHAKFTGEVGVCCATSGPGAIHLLNGLYDAKKDHQPVLAIIGQQARSSLGGHYQQEVDLITLFKDVAHDFVNMVSTPPAIRHQLDVAMRTARATRGVACVIIPNDVQELDYSDPERIHGSVFSGIGYSEPRVVPRDEDLRRAAGVLNSGGKVAMLVGAGALHAQDEVMQVADRLGAGVAKALLGRAVLDDSLPYVTGPIGLLGSKPSWDMMMDCDTLLIVGSSFPYSEFLPKEGQARGVQIDIDGKLVGLRFPTEVNLVGDSAETLRALIPYLDEKQDRSWRERIEKNVAEWWETVEHRAMAGANPINPQRVFWELSPRLPDGCIVTADSGTSADWFARDLRIRRGMMASLSGNLATMGPGVPYAIAAKFAFPDRVAVALVGDGAMQMNGVTGLITIAKYWKEWQDPRLVILVLNNHDLNQVTWEQRVMAGDPKFEASQELPDFPYADYALSLGLGAVRVSDPEQVGSAWEAAFASDRPFVLEAVTDPNVPPLPPHIKFEQAKKFLFSIMKGDPDAWPMIKQSVKEELK